MKFDEARGVPYKYNNVAHYTSACIPMSRWVSTCAQKRNEKTADIGQRWLMLIGGKIAPVAGEWIRPKKSEFFSIKSYWPTFRQVDGQTNRQPLFIIALSG